MIKVSGLFVACGVAEGVGRLSGEKYRTPEVSVASEGEGRALLLRTTDEIVRQLKGVKVGTQIELRGQLGDYQRLEIVEVLNVANTAQKSA